MNFAFHISLPQKSLLQFFFGGVEGKGHWLNRTFFLSEMINDVYTI